MKALEVKKLTKSFKSKFLMKKIEILKNININVEKGQIYGFLGPNGAGKTTTIKCILRLLFPDSGEIFILNQPYNTLEMRKQLGFLPEQPYFYDYLTARELLSFSASLFSIPKRESVEISKRLIQQVGLEGKEDIKLKKYSKGMIQRVGLAQALINDPEILFLDEPFTGLDPIGRKELRDIIISLKNSGKTIFFSSHIIQDMEILVDKVGIILDGEIIREGKLFDLISHSIQYIEIVFTDVDEERIAANNLKYVLQDRNYIVRMNDAKAMNEIIEFVIMNKGRIVSVTPVKLTLEDIFLKEIKE
jgi:ABC-2 type transport system ATP-binding protein